MSVNFFYELYSFVLSWLAGLCKDVSKNIKQERKAVGQKKGKASCKKRSPKVSLQEEE